MNWRGRPLVSHEVVVKLIGATMTKTGLKVKAKLGQTEISTQSEGIRRGMRGLNIEPQDFHGEWNYTIRPRHTKPTR
jgi:hypothetical protein